MGQQAQQIAPDLWAPRAPCPTNPLHDRIPAGLTDTQRDRMARGLDRMVCMMVHWFADRAFTCPHSLAGTIETYKSLVLLDAHNGA